MGAPSATVPVQVATPTPVPSSQAKSARTVAPCTIDWSAVGLVMVITGALVSVLTRVRCSTGLGLG